MSEPYNKSNRKDIYPDGEYKAPKAIHGEEFNNAMNPPNNPHPPDKRPGNVEPTPFNVNDEYPTYGDEGNPHTHG